MERDVVERVCVWVAALERLAKARGWRAEAGVLVYVTDESRDVVGVAHHLTKAFDCYSTPGEVEQLEQIEQLALSDLAAVAADMAEAVAKRAIEDSFDWPQHWKHRTPNDETLVEQMLGKYGPAHLGLIVASHTFYERAAARAVEGHATGAFVKKADPDNPNNARLWYAMREHPHLTVPVIYDPLMDQLARITGWPVTVIDRKDHPLTAWAMG